MSSSYFFYFWLFGQTASWSKGQLVMSAGYSQLIKGSFGQSVKLVGQVSWLKGQMFNWSFGQSASWSVGQRILWSNCQLVQTGHLVSRSVGQLVKGSSGQTVSWSKGQLVSQLVKSAD
jgi:hypothetical protein